MEPPMSLAISARQLCGQAGLLLGWRPQDFWSATPEDMAIALGAMGALHRDPAGVDGATLMQLQEQFPDG